MKQETTVHLTGGKSITFETGKIAKQAHGAAVVKIGDNVVLTTACTNPEPRERSERQVSAMDRPLMPLVHRFGRQQRMVGHHDPERRGRCLEEALLQSLQKGAKYFLTHPVGLEDMLAALGRA